MRRLQRCGGNFHTLVSKVIGRNEAQLCCQRSWKWLQILGVRGQVSMQLIGVCFISCVKFLLLVCSGLDLLSV